MYKNGLTMAKIGEQLDISEATVSRVLKQNKNGKCYLKFPKVNKISPKLFLGNFININDNLRTVRIVPMHNDFKIELVLEVEDKVVQFKL